MSSSAKTVVARYSIPKILAWIGGVAGLGASLWASVAISTAYKIPARHASDHPTIMLFAFGCLAAAFIVALGLALTGGVAIAAVEGAFVFKFLFSRRRVPLDQAMTILATNYMNDTPVSGGAIYQPPPIVLPQLTLRRCGQADLKVRTSLLKEDAETIAARMNAILKADRRPQQGPLATRS